MFHVVVGVCTGAAALAMGYPPYSYFICLIHIDISSVVTEQLVRTRVISVPIDSQGTAGRNAGPVVDNSIFAPAQENMERSMRRHA